MIEILLPVYNGEQYLADQIESILSQTNHDWFLKIRNDGSHDNSYKIINNYCQKYHNKIIEIESPKNNIGLAESLNYLIKAEPHGDYIMFADQDDVWLPNKIQLSIDQMKQLEVVHPNMPLAVFTDLKVVDENLKTISESFFKYQKLYPEVCYDYMASQALNVAPGCTIIINSIAKKFVIPFNTEIIHDHWIINNISYYGKCDFINTATILYRQHHNNTVGTTNVNLEYLLKRFNNPWSHFKSFNHNHRLYKFKISSIRFWLYKFYIYFKRILRLS